MARYDERRPVPALADLLSTVWVQEIPVDSPTYRHRNVPNGSVELRCRLGAAPQVVGPLTGPLAEDLPPGTTVVGLRFRPGAAAAVLGLPASELVDQPVDASELFGDAAEALGERLAEAPTPREALDVLQRQVADRRADTPAPDPLVTEVVRQLMPWRRDDVGSLRSDLGLSESQLRRRCRSAVGLGPKVLHRLLRFQGFLALTQLALAQGKRPAGNGLAAIAVDAGYADQSHLTRECLRLTGRTPGAFLGETSRECGCGHNHAASFESFLRPQHDGFVQSRG